ncbi:hypothetical protein RB213_010987, partial [Colletotrichum asianum]
TELRHCHLDTPSYLAQPRPNTERVSFPATSTPKNQRQTAGCSPAPCTGGPAVRQSQWNAPLGLPPLMRTGQDSSTWDSPGDPPIHLLLLNRFAPIRQSSSRQFPSPPPSRTPPFRLSAIMSRPYRKASSSLLFSRGMR